MWSWNWMDMCWWYHDVERRLLANNSCSKSNNYCDECNHRKRFDKPKHSTHLHTRFLPENWLFVMLKLVQDYGDSGKNNSWQYQSDLYSKVKVSVQYWVQVQWHFYHTNLQVWGSTESRVQTVFYGMGHGSVVWFGGKLCPLVQKKCWFLFERRLNLMIKGMKLSKIVWKMLISSNENSKEKLLLYLLDTSWVFIKWLLKPW